MMVDFDQKLRKYAEVLVRIGLGMQPGDRLLVKAGLDAIDLARAVVEEAYAAGAINVDVLWLDDEVRRARFLHGSEPAWEELPFDTYVQDRVAARGDAFLYLYGEDPELYSDIDTDRVLRFQRSYAKGIQGFWKAQDQSAFPWAAVGAPTKTWAIRVFPDLEPSAAVGRLWEAVFAACRIGEPDPVAAWRTHIDGLAAMCAHLNELRLDSLRYSGPGTDLVVGLPEGHQWIAAGEERPDGRGSYVINLPTEEVFVSPHRDRAEGLVRASKPLSYLGKLVEGIQLRFEGGVVVEASAERGQEVLDGILETDDGARRIGELALVPISSPVAAQGLVWQNMLYDENDACHIALGDGYPASIAGGKEMGSEELSAAGVNKSDLHVDFVVGSAQLDVSGFTASGEEIPLLIGGEWAIDVQQ